MEESTEKERSEGVAKETFSSKGTPGSQTVGIRLGVSGLVGRAN